MDGGITMRVPAEPKPGLRPGPVLLGGHAPKRSPGAFGRRDGLDSATVGDWKRCVVRHGGGGESARAGEIGPTLPSADDQILELTPEDGSLWQLIHGSGRFRTAAKALLVHMLTLGAIGPNELFKVLVTDAERLLTDAAHSATVLLDSAARDALLQRAGFHKATRPLRRPAAREAARARAAPAPPLLYTAAVLGYAAATGAPHSRTDARAVLRYAAALDAAAHAKTGGGTAGAGGGALAAAVDALHAPGPALGGRAGERFAALRDPADHGIRFSRRPMHGGGAQLRIPHSINSRY